MHYSWIIFGDDPDRLLEPFDANLEIEFEERDDGTGYWHNPDSLWDYYTLWGRSDEDIRVKPGVIKQLDDLTVADFAWELSDEELEEKAREWDEERESHPWEYEGFKSREDYLFAEKYFHPYGVILPDGTVVSLDDRNRVEMAQFMKGLIPNLHPATKVTVADLHI